MDFSLSMPIPHNNNKTLLLPFHLLRDKRNDKTADKDKTPVISSVSVKDNAEKLLGLAMEAAKEQSKASDVDSAESASEKG